MQKIINVLSITSFVISVSVVGTGIYLYANKNTLINSAKEKIMGQVSEIAGDKIKEMVPTPSLPNITGPVAPRSTRSGLGVPQF
tara:strand:+ start:1277 stop:1528 length:252 start_codon:yes stop_codon:yes gene_type:complete